MSAVTEVRRTILAPMPPPVRSREVTTTMPKASAAIESIVMYPSSRPDVRGALA